MSVDNLVVGVGRVLTKAGRDGVRIAGGDRRAGGGAEKSGITFVVAVLMAELDSREQRMCEAAGGKPGGQVGLVDSIDTLVVVVVGRQRDGGDGDRDCFKGFLLLRLHRDFQLVFSNMAGYPGNSGWRAGVVSLCLFGQDQLALAGLAQPLHFAGVFDQHFALRPQQVAAV